MLHLPTYWQYHDSSHSSSQQCYLLWMSCEFLDLSRAPSISMETKLQNNCGAQTTPSLFGYWQASTQQCWCGSLLQLPNVQQTSNAPCPTAQWTYGRVSTTFTTYGTSPCRTFANVNLAASAYTQVAGPVSCQRQCRSTRFAYFWGDVRGSNTCCHYDTLTSRRPTEMYGDALAVMMSESRVCASP